MRTAIVSDIHGNLTALQAVIEDLRITTPDLILHGGDLAHGGASPADVVDLIRDLGWSGVLGNTDEMLFDPASLAGFAAKQSPGLAPIFAAIAEMAAAERDALGTARIAWLQTLPRVETRGDVALVHASPASTWRAPAPEAGDEELASTYAPLGQPIAVYGHIHRSFIRWFIRGVAGMTVINTGSVSLSYDGDRRASYLLLDDEKPTIRRVEYDVDQEIRALNACGLPHSDWIAKMLAGAAPLMP